MVAEEATLAAVRNGQQQVFLLQAKRRIPECLPTFR
jgi:hypothetical protein